METIRFRHAHFSARFPVSYRYSPSHFWMAPENKSETIWRVGFTKFATRMLGELVEMVLDVTQQQSVASGQRIGSIEGFKAASDLYCVMEGRFVGSNPTLLSEACVTRSDPYVDGWLYAVEGIPEEGNLDVHGYIELLTQTIERLHSKRSESVE